MAATDNLNNVPFFHNNIQLKCVKYWPAIGTHETFGGDIGVTVDSEEQKSADCMIRKFTFSKPVSKAKILIHVYN